MRRRMRLDPENSPHKLAGEELLPSPTDVNTWVKGDRIMCLRLYLGKVGIRL